MIRIQEYAFPHQNLLVDNHKGYVRRGGNLQKYALRPTIFYLMVLWPLADPVAVHDWS